MDIMKFVISKHRAINLATINTIFISDNYLQLTTEAGQNAREIRLIYGTDTELGKLFDAIMAFVNDYQVVVAPVDMVQFHPVRHA
jgi:hypothetical protein